jgi:hypothetical protein
MIFFKKNIFFVLFFFLIFGSIHISHSSDFSINQNLTVTGEVLLEDNVTSNAGIHITNGVFLASGKININDQDTNSFSITLGNKNQPSTIYFNNIPQGDLTQKLGLLTIDQNGVVYVSFDITPLPTDPYQINSLTANEIIDKNNNGIYINSASNTNQNTDNNNIFGDTILGNSYSNITIASGSILFNGVITTSFPSIILNQPCFFTQALTTNNIKTTNLIIGSEGLKNPITITVDNNTEIITQSVLNKNNVNISNAEGTISFENNTILIGSNSPNSTISISPLKLPYIANTNIRDPENSYLFLVQQENTNNTAVVFMPNSITTNNISVSSNDTVTYINTNNQNNTVVSIDNIAFDTNQINIQGPMDSNLQTLSISVGAIFQENVFIGTPSNKDFSSKKQISLIEKKRTEKRAFKKEIEHFYKEIMKTYE